MTAFVPGLELEHARAQSGLARVEHYVEYPYEPHPMQALRQAGLCWLALNEPPVG